jgi:hypothetical protein
MPTFTKIAAIGTATIWQPEIAQQKPRKDAGSGVVGVGVQPAREKAVESGGQQTDPAGDGAIRFFRPGAKPLPVEPGTEAPPIRGGHAADRAKA